MRLTLSKGVSEVISAMLILFIVVAIGVSLYLYLYSQTMMYQQIVSKRLLEEELSVQEQLSILLVVGYSNGTIHVVYFTGPSQVRLYSIYVNDTLAVSYNPPRLLSPFTTYDQTIYSPIPLSSNSIIQIKIVHGGGEASALGQVK